MKYSRKVCLVVALLGTGTPLFATTNTADVATAQAAAKGGGQLPDAPSFSLKQLLQRAEKHLNSFKSLHARFRQEDPDGTLRSGELYLQKPGKLRLTYKTPAPMLLVSDGDWISYDDPELDQVSYVPLSSTPAAFIMHESIDFSSLIVDRVEFSPEQDILISLRSKTEPELGTLTLTFKDNPMRLVGWQVVDQSTQTTTVTLKEVSLDVVIPKGSFDLSNPHN